MTDKSAREIVAGAVLGVCSDGNSDNNRVASDILAALEAGGFAVVPVERLLSAFVAGFRISGEGWNGEHPGDVGRAELKTSFDAWLAAHRKFDAAASNPKEEGK